MNSLWTGAAIVLLSLLPGHGQALKPCTDQSVQYTAEPAEVEKHIELINADEETPALAKVWSPQGARWLEELARTTPRQVPGIRLFSSGRTLRINRLLRRVAPSTAWQYSPHSGSMISFYSSRSGGDASRQATLSWMWVQANLCMTSSLDTGRWANLASGNGTPQELDVRRIDGDTGET